MPYIEMAVPLGFPISEPLVAAFTLPADERPVTYTLQMKSGEEWFSLNRTSGDLTLHKPQQRNAIQTGTSVIEIYGARPLRPQNAV